MLHLLEFWYRTVQGRYHLWMLEHSGCMAFWITFWCLLKLGGHQKVTSRVVVDTLDAWSYIMLAIEAQKIHNVSCEYC